LLDGIRSAQLIVCGRLHNFNAVFGRQPRLSEEHGGVHGAAAVSANHHLSQGAVPVPPAAVQIAACWTQGTLSALRQTGILNSDFESWRQSHVQFYIEKRCRQKKLFLSVYLFKI